MKISLKTEVFKSLAVFLTLLLIYSCDSSEEKKIKQNKVETHLTKNKDNSNKDVESNKIIEIESKIEIDKVEKNKPSLSEIKNIEPIEISDSTKSTIQNKPESVPFKYSGHPFAGSGASSNKKNGVGEPGIENKIIRYYISSPNLKKIKSEEFCKVSFKVSVDANGNVISARVTSSGTTTNNQSLINQVRELVKSELKYNKVDPDTPVFIDNISRVIQPN